MPTKSVTAPTTVSWLNPRNGPPADGSSKSAQKAWPQEPPPPPSAVGEPASGPAPPASAGYTSSGSDSPHRSVAKTRRSGTRRWLTPRLRTGFPSPLATERNTGYRAGRAMSNLDYSAYGDDGNFKKGRFKVWAVIIGVLAAG